MKAVVQVYISDVRFHLFGVSLIFLLSPLIFFLLYPPIEGEALGVW